MNREDSSLRVLVVADDQLSRAGLSALLAQQPGCVVAGQISTDEFSLTGGDVFQADVAVWDLGWEPESALEQLSDGRGADPPAVALLPDDSYAAEAWAAGARGALLRDVEGPALLSALDAVAHGLAVAEPGISLALGRRSVDPPPSDLARLTPREAEVLTLLAEGLANKTIAQRLDISEHTVKFHVNAILSKMEAQSRTEAVTRATRMGLLSL